MVITKNLPGEGGDYLTFGTRCSLGSEIWDRRDNLGSEISGSPKTYFESENFG